MTLESPLPASLPAGADTAVFVPRALLRAGRGRASTACRTAPAAGRRPLLGDGAGAARGDGDRGAGAGRPLGRIPVAPAAPPALAAGRPGLIAVCMATFEPDLALFRAQVESLRAQTDTDWVCVDQRRRLGARARTSAIRAVLGDDPRFLLSRAERRPASTATSSARCGWRRPRRELLALCDQDDRWQPGQARRRCARRSAARRSPTPTSGSSTPTVACCATRMWQGRRNNHTDLVSMLVANSITGAAMLLRRDVAELALPFPDTPGACSSTTPGSALVALAAGEIAYVDRPLYDYVQHRGAVFGAVTHGERPPRAAPQPEGRLLPRLPAARAAGRDAAAALRAARRPSGARWSASSPPSAPRSRSCGSRPARCACCAAAPRRSAARASCCRG